MVTRYNQEAYKISRRRNYQDLTFGQSVGNCLENGFFFTVLTTVVGGILDLALGGDGKVGALTGLGIGSLGWISGVYIGARSWKKEERRRLEQSNLENL